MLPHFHRTLIEREVPIFWNHHPKGLQSWLLVHPYRTASEPREGPARILDISRTLIPSSGSIMAPAKEPSNSNYSKIGSGKNAGLDSNGVQIPIALATHHPDHPSKTPREPPANIPADAYHRYGSSTMSR